MVSTNLDLEVRQALERRRGTWPGIAKACGVSHSWISKFVRGEIPNPGYRTLQQLDAHLKTSPPGATTQLQEQAHVG